MSIVLGARSLSNMVGVHPDLVRVFKRAAAIAEAHEDFTIIEGVRSREQMMVNYGKGRSAATLAKFGIPASYAKPGAAKVTWLNNPFMSNHRAQQGGGRAIDAVPFPVDWNDIARFKKLAALIKRAADLEGVAISQGANWTKKDWPHTELA